MTLKSAIWMSANAAHIEYEDRVQHLSRKGWGIKVVQEPNSSNWFHFPLTAPIILDGQRLAIEKIFVLYQTQVWRTGAGQDSAIDAPLSMLKHLHLYDGARRVLQLNDLNRFHVNNGLHDITEDTVFVPDHPIVMYRAPSISVRIDFGPSAYNEVNGEALEFAIEFSNVGLDCVIA